MNVAIQVLSASLREVLAMVKEVDEFSEAAERTEKEYLRKIGNAKSLCLIGYMNKKPAGFFMGYDRYGDGSFYCWRVGVLSAFRRKGILRSMMQFVEQWATDQDFRKLKLTTRNSRRSMLSYLIREGYCFTEVVMKDEIEDYRIKAEKELAIKLLRKS
ncbi:MAG: GNAT family N-acetyltransferase [Candidatus Peribacteraceae bacterium]|nr:GNAT family N-acetyltransferase [Candidatus Peribacteraceae bacterium]